MLVFVSGTGDFSFLVFYQRPKEIGIKDECRWRHSIGIGIGQMFDMARYRIGRKEIGGFLLARL